MDFKQLEAFAAVISLGSFSKAGERLFLTQPTVSAHIRTLEKELGMKLIERTTKEVHASEAGKCLYVYAQTILRMRDDAIAAIKTQPGAQLGGTLTIAASTVPAQYLLPEVGAAFRQAHPGVSFRVLRCDSALVAKRVAAGEAVVGMTGSAVQGPHCVCRMFLRDELMVVTPNTPEFRALGKEGFPMEALIRKPFILREQGSGTRREFEQFLEQLGIRADQLQIAAEMEDPESIKRTVSEGMGISVMSKRAVEDFCQLGLLLAHPLSDADMVRGLYLVSRKNVPLPNHAQAFSDFVVTYYRRKENPKWDG